MGRPSLFWVFALTLYCGANAAVPSSDELCQCSVNACDCTNRGTNSSDVINRNYCHENLHSLNVSNNWIAALELSSCTGLTHLLVRSNNLSVLNNSSFQFTTGLTYLDIGNNSFHYYGSDTFSGLGETLIELVADHNPVRIIGKFDFSKLRNLQRLVLTANHIGYIQEGSFQNSSQLRELYLDQNFFTDLEIIMFQGLQNLRLLDLSSNPIKRIPWGTFSDLGDLDSLFITYRQHIPMNHNTEITPGVFANLTKLKTLKLMDLRIIQLPSAFLQGLSQLERFICVNNSIFNYSVDMFQDTPALDALDLSNNRLKCLPQRGFASLPQLTLLNVSHNLISYIYRQAFDGLPQLKQLSLQGNPVHKFALNAMCSLTSVNRVEVDPDIEQYGFASKYVLPTVFSTRTSVYGLRVGEVNDPPLQGVGKPCEEKENTDSSSADQLPSSQCPMVPHSLEDIPPGSRIYLLIIIGVCISFLLIAFIVILSFRAWSKRRLRYDEAHTELVGMSHCTSPTTVGGVDKQQLAMYSPVPGSDTADANLVLGAQKNGHSHSVGNGSVTQPHSEQQQANGSRPVTTHPPTTHHSSSLGDDDDDEPATITALGVV